MITIFLCIAFIIVFAIYSGQCIPAASSAVNQFLCAVLPSLLPFYVASDILRKTDFCERIGIYSCKITNLLFKISGEGSLAIIIGYISGYPAGAKIASDLYTSGKISYEDAVRLSIFTNNTGPLFIIGTIGVGILHNVQFGIKLLLIHIISSLITGVVLNHLISSKKIAESFSYVLPNNLISNANKSKITVSDISDSITNSIYAMLPVGASIIFFAAFNEALISSNIINTIFEIINAEALIPSVEAFTKSIFEITSGISAFAEIPSLSCKALLIIISGVCGFAGISIHLQVAGIYNKVGIPAKYYFAGKIMQAAAAVAAAACIL